MAAFRSVYAERNHLCAVMRAEGKTWVEIGTHFRERYGVNARKAMRWAHGYSQADVARIWCDHWPDEPKTADSVSSWERWPEAGYEPSLVVLDRLAEIYECDAADLLADRAHFSHLDRANEAALSTAEQMTWMPRPGLNVGIDLLDLDDALSSGRVTATTVVAAEQASAELDTRYAELPAERVADELQGQHAKVVSWLRQPQQPSQRQRLCSVAARLSGLRAWLMFDLAHYGSAESWYAIATRAAFEADDSSLLAWLFGARSLIPSYCHDHRAAMALIEAGQSAGGSVANPTVLAWLDALEARAHAGTGNAAGFSAAARSANHRLAETHSHDRHHGMDFADGMLTIAYYEGGGELLLGHPGEAEERLRAGFAALAPDRIKAKSILLLSLAMAAAQSRDFDKAAATACEALEIGRHQPIMPIWQRVQDLRNALSTRSPQAATTLERHLAAFARASQFDIPEPAL